VKNLLKSLAPQSNNNGAKLNQPKPMKKLLSFFLNQM